MTHEQFKILLEELDGTGVKILAEKNSKYSTSDDALQNFHEGAEIMGCTTAQACWGYMTKHLSALRKMIWSNDFSNREDVYEKCIDIINYVRFLWAISEEERNKAVKDNTPYTVGDCRDCRFNDLDSNDEPCVSCKNCYAEDTDFPINFQPRH